MNILRKSLKFLVAAVALILAQQTAAVEQGELEAGFSYLESKLPVQNAAAAQAFAGFKEKVRQLAPDTPGPTNAWVAQFKEKAPPPAGVNAQQLKSIILIIHIADKNALVPGRREVISGIWPFSWFF